MLHTGTNTPETMPPATRLATALEKIDYNNNYHHVFNML
ncbi:unnamed protein product, partial [Rotaria magnacalcarata]